MLYFRFVSAMLKMHEHGRQGFLKGSFTVLFLYLRYPNINGITFVNVKCVHHTYVAFHVYSGKNCFFSDFPKFTYRPAPKKVDTMIPSTVSEVRVIQWQCYKNNCHIL